MGFINDLKKIFFGVESVSKSAAKKAGNKGKEIADDINESTEEIRNKLRERSRESLEKGKEKLEDLSKQFEERSQKVSEDIEDIGKDVLEKGDKLWDKTKEVSEDIGNRILHGKNKEKGSSDHPSDSTESNQSSDLRKKAEEKLEDLGRKVQEEGKKMADKAKEILDNPEESVDKVMERADDLGRKIKDRVTTDADDLADTTLDEKMKEHQDSSLDGKDDFFDKAERFAEGDHHIFDADADKPRIVESKEGTKKKKSADDDSKVPGFEDRDGDGDELVDDAEIVDEEE